MENHRLKMSLNKMENRLTYIEPSDKKSNSGKKYAWYECKCEKKTKKEIIIDAVKSGNTKSCGCLKKPKPIIKHNKCYTGEYRSHQNMKSRCYRTTDKYYKDYGGRGIIVCERWLGKKGFENFYKDMGPKPSPKHTLERIKIELNYEPSNCKWATTKEQNRNRTDTHRLEYNGQNYCIGEWAERLGLPPYIIYSRIKSGWSSEKALTTPIDMRFSIKRC